MVEHPTIQAMERWRAEKLEDEAMPRGVVIRFPGETLV
jgi:hypothetical protein